VTVGDTGWRRHGLALAFTIVALLALFAGDSAAIARIWWTSTTFGHCLFIAPVLGWLVWQRRAELARLTPVGWAPGLAIVAVGGFGWLLGDAGSVAFARHFGLLLMVQGAVVTLLGPNVARGLLFPLCYAVFLVPFGEWLEPPLQDATVAITMPLLHLAGVPASVDGVLIHAGANWFEVAEACSGAKFVIAMLAFSVLVAHLGFTAWRRRAAFMVVALVVPVIANGIRAFATIWAAHLTSVEAAAGFDHIVYGWLFFAAVMAAVLAIGWHWFDRAPDDAAFDPARLQAIVRHRLPLGLAVASTLAVACVGSTWSAVTADRAARLPAHITLADVPGWTRVPLSRDAAWAPNYPGADHRLLGRYARGRDAVDVAIAVYGAQDEERELVGFGRGVLREEDRWIRVADLPPIAGGSAMRITTARPGGGTVERVVATWYRLGDVTTASGKRVKFETMTARLLGRRQAAVAVHLSVEVAPGVDPAAAIRRFLADAGPVDAIADRAAGRG
jgi:exosortase A